MFLDTDYETINCTKCHAKDFMVKKINKSLLEAFPNYHWCPDCVHNANREMNWRAIYIELDRIERECNKC